ncbi:MAG: hypothetical protein JXR61_09010 [Prolixibacteraceae bacterium]|nr:hypothetical protein [Prolixibacteraceae bacterium]
MMQFKQLDIKPEGNWFQRIFLTPHAKKTAIYVLIGIIAGPLLMLLTDNKSFAEFSSGEFFQSIFLGGLFGFFITNSPCARGRC